MALPMSLEDMLQDGTRSLVRAGIEGARRDARLLAGAALGKPPDEMIALRNEAVDWQAQAAFEAMVARRAGGEPVSRILGRRGFWTLDLTIGPEVLDPRPDSETLVETALRLTGATGGDLRILDLGTGSGCLMLALLAELPAASGVGIDKSPDAARLAHQNARACGLASRASFICSDWAAPIAGRFDLVVSNPPYIVHADLMGLAPDVALFDPALALDGGADGLDAYRALIPALPALLVPGGLAVLEFGLGQGADVGSLMQECGLANLEIVCDLAGHERCIAARRLTAKKPLE